MLHSGRLLDHATLGATVSTDDVGRVLVTNILSSSDAYRRGLRYGDEVLSLADREVDSTNTFKNILGTLPKDLRVPMEIRREGQSQTILVRLYGVHTSEQLIELVRIGLGDGPPRPEPPPNGRNPDAKDPDAKDPDTEDPDTEGPEGDDPGAKEADDREPDHQLVASMLEHRPGFANYFYNRQHRNRLWDQIQTLGDFSQPGGWKLAGNLAGEQTRVEISLDDQTAAALLGFRQTSLQGDLSDSIAQRSEAGLLVAFKALRELLRDGPERIGDTIYLGNLPIYRGVSKSLPDQPWADVLESLWYDTRARFYWDSQQQEIPLIEVFGDDGVDPVEVYLDRYREFESGGYLYRFPSRCRLQYGTDIQLMIEFDQVEFGQVEAPSSAAENPVPEGDAQ
jgi:serine protease Do